MINAIRAHMAEYGIVAPVGRKGVEQLLAIVTDAGDERVPEVARACLAALGAQLRALKAQILAFDRQIIAWHRSNEISRRLGELGDVARYPTRFIKIQCLADLWRGRRRRQASDQSRP